MKFDSLIVSLLILASYLQVYCSRHFSKVNSIKLERRKQRQKIFKNRQNNTATIANKSKAIAVCKEFVDQCEKAAKSLNIERRGTADQLCKFLKQGKDECLSDVEKNIECWDKCSNITANKTQSAALWVAAFVSCAVCDPNYQKEALESEEICKLEEEECQSFIRDEKDDIKRDELEEICSDVHKKQKNCLTKVETNPICYALCIGSCGEIVGNHDIKEWRKCIEECDICEIAAKETNT
eukprot:TRINITY_DN9693_c0_g1_i3.p1 TRINITY_DN9693_c0_g1~~TRINITY_DN9693_c0_g1_i3.p1  ORF type:complete len:239 (+),score=16.02 TRINITY_DN9693_c0_g1_i3:118-834(+)